MFFFFFKGSILFCISWVVGMLNGSLSVLIFEDYKFVVFVFFIKEIDLEDIMLMFVKLFSILIIL